MVRAVEGRPRRARPPRPADIIHEGNASDVTKQLVVTGKAGTSWVWVNQMPELKKNTKDELGVVAYPGDPSAQWARASMYLSVFSGSTKHRTSAVDVINFLVNDPEAGKILGTDRGLPSNLDVRKAVADSVDRPEHEAVDRGRERARREVRPGAAGAAEGPQQGALRADQGGRGGPVRPARRRPQAAEAFIAAGKAADRAADR